MQKVFVISHASDIDGVGSSALLKMKFSLPDGNIFFTNYSVNGITYVEKQLERHFKKDITLYLTDLGVSTAIEPLYERILKKVRKFGGKVYWYDHHPWTPGQIKKLASLCEVAVIGENKDYCATEITHKELGFNDKFTNAFVKLVHYSDFNLKPKSKSDYEMVGRYALSIASYNTNEALGTMTKRLRHVASVISKRKFLDKRIISDANKFNKLNQSRVDKMLGHLELGSNFAVGFTTHVQSTYACDAILKATRKKIALCINVEKGRGSIRSTGPDISGLARSLGGGGHPHASGFTFDTKKFNWFKSKKDKEKFAAFIQGRISKMKIS